ncbi:MAG: gliding motility-associated C-terminal domain-containing protein, partial [Flavobacteriia bacterium]|nr:gliding motility-associated C-terminal domain-containing protein [Flavobacteriia bacterium]
VTVSATGGTAPYSGTGNFNQSAGSVTYTVTDFNGCTSTTTIVVTQPSAVVASSVLTTPIACFGGSAVVTVSGSGGTAPYAGTGTFSVVAGTYTYTITDANLCSTTTTIIVTEPSLLTASSVITTPVACNGGSAVVTVSGSGGTAPYSGTGTFSVVAGTYSYTLTDANLCSTTTTIVVTEPSLLASSSLISTPIACNGGTATVTVSGSGGTVPYTGTGTFSVVAGTYTYTVTDANLCSTTTTIIVTEPSLLAAASVITTPVACFGGTAIVTVSGSGGTAPYTGTGTFSVVAGSFTYTVTDVNLCSTTTTIVVAQPTTLAAASVITTPIACFGGSATINVSGSGGTAPYAGTGTFSVVAGTYTYTVTDVNLCSTATTIVVTQPIALVAASVISSPIVTFGGTGVITVTGSGGSAPYTGTGNFTVNSGTYTYTVTDANGCTSTTTITITEPGLLSAASVITIPIACNGGTATVTVSASGGTAPYAGTGTFSVVAGTYTYTVTDINSNTATTTITITEPNALVANSVITTPIACFGGSATVTISGTGGTAPYAGIGTFIVVGGTYTYTVTDANLCSTSTTIIVTEPSLLAASSVITTPVACFGGSATVTVSGLGGTAPYSGTGTFSIVAGTYTYTVTDANLCSTTTTIIVTEPSLLAASSVITTPVACFGGTATVTVSGTGGTAPYSGTGNFNQSAGSVTYTITDLNGCTSTTTIVVAQPSSVVASSVLTSPVACNGGTAVVAVSATGGTAPYTGTGNFNQSAGSVTYTITDFNGCTSTTSIIVNQPSTIVATSVITTPIACNGGSAVVTVSASGGTAPYTGTGTFSVVTGTYSYTLTDANLCSTTTTIIVTEPSSLAASSVITTPIACNGGTATVTVSGTGGTAPYTGTGTFSVVAGTYTYTVTDLNLCSITTTIVVTQPTALVAASVITTPIACNGGTAAVTVSATGGTGAYTGTGTFTVSAGTYNYTVTDANGCTSTTTIVVAQPSAVVASSVLTTPIACSGGTAVVTVSATGGTGAYTGTGTFTVSAGTYNYTVTDANGCTSTTTIVVAQPTALVAASVITTPIACFGGTATVTVSGSGGTVPYTGTGTFSVVAGTYTYTLTDANLCSTTTTIIVTEPSLLAASSVITTPIACFGGTATVTVSGSGGTVPYTGTGIFSVVAGTYTYTVTDANGCNTTTTIIVTEPSLLAAASVITTPIACIGGSATINVSGSGGTAPYTGTGTFSVVAGTYTYTVIDANLCSTTTTIVVTQPTALVATSVITTPIACNGGTAVVTVSATGGTGAYTGTGTFTVSAGTYNYTVTDANGCSSITNIVVTEPTQLVASSTLTTPVACNGGTAVVTVSASGGTAPYTGTGTFSVVAGSYTYTVTDANGCTSTTTIIISQPTLLLTNSVLVTPIICNGGAGVVTVTASGGTAPYTGTGTFNVNAGTYNYLITDGNGCTSLTTITVTQPLLLVANATITAPILCSGGSAVVGISGAGGTSPYTGVGLFSVVAGFYSYTITDANNCIATTSITVLQPTFLTTIVSGQDVTCFGANDGQAISNTNGGTQNYSYLWSNLSSLPNLTGLAPGTYSVIVTDANGCVAYDTVTIIEPPLLTANSILITPIACNGGTAVIDVTASGGVGPYFGVGISNLPAGTNNIIVTDMNGCTATTTITINQPALLIATSAVTNAILCNGGSATVTVSATGGTSPYIGTGTFSVIAGSYTYTVTDANGCTATSTIIVNQPALLAATITATNVLCNGANNGQALAVVTGGTPGFTYLWSNSQTTIGISPLVPATYFVLVTDANGCTANATATITQPAILTMATSQTNILCFGNSTGSISITPSGGTSPYFYLWSNGMTTQNLTNILAGTYSLVLTDNNGCTINGSFTLTQPATAITATETHVNVLCFANNTGAIDLTVSGGVPGYTYLWSNTATTQDLLNLIAGTYTVIITDLNNCSLIVPIQITQPSAILTINSNVTNVTCFGYNDGQINVTMTGGTAPYTYFWLGSGATTEDLTNVSPGSYTLAVTDNNNCVTSATITVNQPSTPLSASILQNPISCYGYNDGQLSAVGAGGTIPYTYLWNTAQTTSVISLLGAGGYTVTITDASGCQSSISDFLTNPPTFIANFAVSDAVACIPATIDFFNSTIGNYISASWTLSNGTLSSNLNGFQEVFSATGCYDLTLTVVAANGCIATNTIQDAVCIVAGPTASFTSTTPEIDFATGEIIFVNTSINEDQVLWEFGDGTQSNIDNPTHNYPPQTYGSYNVTLFAIDTNGCIDSITQTFELNDDLKLNVPNSFTPNGDGLNDVFIPIFNMENSVKEYKFEVYNRWGQLVYETEDVSDGWDGKYKSKICQSGTYNWIVYYQDYNKNPFNVNGHITLLK